MTAPAEPSLEKKIYTVVNDVARYVGIPAEKIYNFIGVVKICGFELAPTDSLKRLKERDADAERFEFWKQTCLSLDRFEDQWRVCIPTKAPSDWHRTAEAAIDQAMKEHRDAD